MQDEEDEEDEKGEEDYKTDKIKIRSYDDLLKVIKSDTSKYNESTVKYLDTGDSLTVQWENVPLQDHPSAGNFTFQAGLESVSTLSLRFELRRELRYGHA